MKDNAGNECIPKGPKFSQKALAAIDYSSVDLSWSPDGKKGWTTDAKVNALVAVVILYPKQFK